MIGCILRLLVLPLLALASVTLFNFWLPGPLLKNFSQASPTAGILVGIFTWFIWMSLLDIRRYKKYRMHLHNPAFEEGKSLVVSGYLLSKETPLKAPFSGEDCLGYHYRVMHSSRMGSHSTDWTDYEGYALIPSVIRSHFGEYKILAKPNEFFYSDFKIIKYKDIFEKVKKYLSNTEFTETIHEPGNFKIDKQINKTIDMREENCLREKNCWFEEKTIKANDLGLISGVYSSNPLGIAPHPDEIFNPFKIIPNGEAGMLKKVKNRWIGIWICTFLITLTTLVQYLVVIK
ncbi:hypothetical protein K8T06_12765 [bacterium]|nr:hypothetical protein [bacterium]